MIFSRGAGQCAAAHNHPAHDPDRSACALEKQNTMAIRTGKEYVAGLRDQREVWYDGQRVTDVTEFPDFRATIDSFAQLYDLQHDSRYADILVAHPPEFDEPVGRAFEIPRSAEQLRLKREAYTIWAQANCGMLGRSPDFLNVMLAALAAKRSFFAEASAERRGGRS